jgi:hypothetical protein
VELPQDRLQLALYHQANLGGKSSRDRDTLRMIRFSYVVIVGKVRKTAICKTLRVAVMRRRQSNAVEFGFEHVELSTERPVSSNR